MEVQICDRIAVDIDAQVILILPTIDRTGLHVLGLDSCSVEPALWPSRLDFEDILVKNTGG